MNPYDPYEGMPPEPPDGAGEATFPEPGQPLSELVKPEGEAEGERGTAGLYVSRADPTSLIKVLEEDAFGVKMARLDGSGRWTMPRAEYDEKFVKLWRPATLEDLEGMNTGTTVRPPANAPDGWR
jgi:hypothetical protein